MELLIFLIITIALILIVWRINSKTFVIQPPSYPLVQKKQEEQSNFVPTEDEKDRMRKHSSVDDSYNDRSADSPYDDDDRSSSSDDHWSSSNWDGWTSSGSDDGGGSGD
jgi:hypothetical protein